MSKRSRSQKKKMTNILLVLAAVLVLTLGAMVWLLFGMDSKPPVRMKAETGEADVLRELPAASEESTVPVEMFTVAADGNASGVKCKSSYTVGPEAAASLAKQNVASAGTARLTNAQLQLRYLAEASDYRANGAEVQPVWSQPLDSQRCPLGDGDLSWQHYFLVKAIRRWQVEQALLAGAKEPQVITEKAFKPDLTTNLHETYIAPELPVNNFLYQNQPHFIPNSQHQAWLDGLNDTLEANAKAAGFDSLADYAAKTFGTGVSAAEIVNAAKDLNTAYMYYTELGYSLEEVPVPEGVTGGEELVNFRHILLVPEGAQVAADGTVTATDEQWEKCRQTAQELMEQIRSGRSRFGNARGTFAINASLESMDAGSRANGGLYTGIRKGQMIPALDEWLFAADRKFGVMDLLRSEVGYHIVLLDSVTPEAAVQKQAAVRREQRQKLVDSAMTNVLMKPDYSAAALWADVSCPDLVLDSLYPDVGHERFPEPIVYLQQDYHYSQFGAGQIGRSGCGITTMAMLATYMTDTVQSPAMMGARFPQYYSSGTDGNIFIYGINELGFYLESRAFSVDDIIPALENGQVVISQQLPGHFTTSGHYILLTQYHEEDDTFTVRDSNIYNYGSKAGHKIDRFTRDNILSGGTNFYVMQPKAARISSCARCGADMTEQPPSRLFRQGYICPRCTESTARRDLFLDILGNI